jgi:uncharacterized damage-inducible protein DinB
MTRTRVFAVLMAAFSTAALSVPLHAQAPVTGWRAEYLDQMKDIEGKYTQLATAMPWDKYSWRPAKGVRSVCEVFLHVSGDNVAIAASLGAKTPAGIDLNTVETCPASKEKVLAEMQALFAAVRSAVVATPDGDADAVVDFFGSKRTKRALLLALAEHSGEHLGQSIAYARMNGVVPPWSAAPPK